MKWTKKIPTENGFYCLAEFDDEGKYSIKKVVGIELASEAGLDV